MDLLEVVLVGDGVEGSEGSILEVHLGRPERALGVLVDGHACLFEHTLLNASIAKADMLDFTEVLALELCDGVGVDDVLEQAYLTDLRGWVEFEQSRAASLFGDKVLIEYCVFQESLQSARWSSSLFNGRSLREALKMRFFLLP